MNILQMFSYPFMQRALIAGVLVSLCAALLGVPLVLKRYSMIGDGLSHVSFGALAIAVALGVTPLYFSIPVVMLAAFFLLRMASHPHWNSDAAIAAVSASALAIGILVISRTTGMTTDVDNYMFGSVLAMTKGDVALSVILSVTVLTLYLLFYHQIFAVTFDESFSRATGLKVDACNTLLAILTALTIVLGMRMMGAMLISSLVIFPALTAMRLFKSFRGVLLCAAVTSVVCFCVGLTISFGFFFPLSSCRSLQQVFFHLDMWFSLYFFLPHSPLCTVRILFFQFHTVLGILTAHCFFHVVPLAFLLLPEPLSEPVLSEVGQPDFESSDSYPLPVP